MKPLYLLICLLSFLSSCSYFKNVGLLLGGEVIRENYVQTLPFTLRKDLIVVNARLNDDTASHAFIFDTGAFNSKVEYSLADKLKLEVVSQKTNSTAQANSRRIEVARVDSLQLGETWFYNIGAGKLSYDSASASRCVAGSGIIGANLMKLAHWKIDFQNQQLYFSDSPFEVDDQSHSLDFDRPLLSGTPEIEVNINGRRVQHVLLDVGYNGGLVLPISLADQFESPEQQIILDHSTSGIYGTSTDSLIVKKLSVEVAGHQDEVPVEFSSLNKALLGNAFLRHFTLTIDYDEEKIYLAKQQEVLVATPRSFHVGVLDDTRWIVNRTRPDLPLSLGDTLLSVNGKLPQELFTSYCDYFMNIHQLFERDTLVVQRSDGDFLTIKNESVFP